MFQLFSLWYIHTHTRTHIQTPKHTRNLTTIFHSSFNCNVNERLILKSSSSFHFFDRLNITSNFSYTFVYYLRINWSNKKYIILLIKVDFGFWVLIVVTIEKHTETA